MNRKELLYRLFKDKNIYKALPDCMGLKPYKQNVYSYLNNKDITLLHLTKICNYLGYKLLIMDNDNIVINLTDEYNNSVK